MKNSIVKFRYSIIALLMMIVHGVGAFASAPWTVNPNDYRYDMSVYLNVLVDSEQMDYSKYEVAAFVGDECRGIGEPLSLTNGKECLYMRIRSNEESGETLQFRYCEKETGKVFFIPDVSIQFESNGLIGYPSSPYLISLTNTSYFELSLSAGNGGTVDQESGFYAEDTELTITATPWEGYSFSQWSDGSTDNPRTIIINKNITLEAAFTINSYQLIYMVDGEKYKEYTLQFGAEIPVEEDPVKEGYTFSGWDTVPETMPANDVTVSGTFSVNSYKAVFKIGEEIIETKTIEYGSKVEAPEAPAKEGHTFTGWQDLPETMPAHDIEILGSYTVNKYKLTYMLDGETFKEYEIEYGSDITAEPELTKEGYTFSGWEGLPETMPANDVTVSGSFSVNSYNAVFKIGDDIIDTKTIEYGSKVEAPEAPAKEGHTFAGWADVPETMPAHDIEILGSYTVNKYKLTYTVDGETYKEEEVEYGAEITAEPELTKEGYTFSGWEGLPETMPANDVTVSGTFSVNSYKAVFKIGEEIIETKTIAYGSKVEAPEAPAKEGHTFAGWADVPETMPAHDIEILGSYTVNKYKLTYMLDGETFKEYEIEYGSDITAEPEPTKEGYTFSGWEGLPETMPANDVTVSGTFSINSYNAVFKIGEDIIETKTIEYGSKIDTPEAPAKEGHTFAGWADVPETMPAHDIEILGSYTVNKYKLTYTVDGETFKEYEVEYGTEITAEPEPTKEGYTFSGWDGLPETMPANDVTVSGTFSVNSYKAVFKIGEEIIETKTIAYGSKVEAPEAPAKEGHTFAGWQDVPETMPAHDIEILGSYTVNKYKLTYMLDAETYKEYEVEYGTEISAEPEPTKEGYTFSGWDGLPETMPAKDVTVSGSFSVNSYNAVFKIGDDIIETKTIEYGSKVEAPEAPSKEGHTFAGWQDVPETMPAHDIEILGSYTVNKYKLTYTVDGETYKEEEVEYGTEITAEPEPTKEGHTFSGWDGLPETMPANDVTVSGTFSINSYKAVFKIGEEIIETKTIAYGSKVEAPEAPAKEGHTFAGWQDVPETMPAHDIEILGSYTVNKYKLTYTVDGETYKEYEIEYGSDITVEPEPTKEGYTFSGWKGLPGTMPANDVTVSGTFSVNSYNAVFKIGEEIIETKTIAYGNKVETPEAPAKEGHTFTGWQDVPETMPAHDIEILGSYTVNKYKLTYTVDGETYKEEEVEYGTEITAEPEPTKEGYTFSGWEGLPETMPANDVTVSGTFSINSYKAVFKIGDDIIETKTIEYGSKVEAPDAPAKEGHTFAGWHDVPETMPAHDIEILGSYEVNYYLLSVYLNEELIYSEELAYGAEIVLEDPEVPEGMKFDGWSSEVPEYMPAHDVDIYGSYSEFNAVWQIELDDNEVVTVYDMQGHIIYHKMSWRDVREIISKGIYIINGAKHLIK